MRDALSLTEYLLHYIYQVSGFVDQVLLIEITGYTYLIFNTNRKENIYIPI